MSSRAIASFKKILATPRFVQVRSISQGTGSVTPNQGYSKPATKSSNVDATTMNYNAAFDADKIADVDVKATSIEDTLGVKSPDHNRAGSAMQSNNKKSASEATQTSANQKGSTHSPGVGEGSQPNNDNFLKQSTSSQPKTGF